MDTDEVKYSAIRYPSIRQHGNKFLAFIDPSKAEEDKLSEEYLKEMVEMNKELNSRARPYNKTDLQRSDLITTSMKDEVALKKIIQNLTSEQDSPTNIMYLREEQDHAEKRARRHYIIFQENLINADTKDLYYSKRPYLSHGTFMKLLIILQFNLLQKFRYPSEKMEYNGVLTLVVYTMLYVLVGVPVQFAMRALSQYSKATIITVWDFCPFFKGAGFMILIYAVYYMLRSTAFSAILLYMAVDVLKGTVGWTTCDDTLHKKCTTASTVATKLSDCHAIYNIRSWPDFDSSGLSYYRTLIMTSFSGYENSLKWEGLLALLAVWLIILVFLFTGFEIFFVIVNVLFIPIILTGVAVFPAMVYFGGSKSASGLRTFFDVDLSLIKSFPNHMIYSQIFFDVLVMNGIINFLAAHTPHDVDPMVDTYIFALTDLSITYCTTLAAFTAAGFLQNHYRTSHPICFLNYRDIILLATIPEFLSRIPGGTFWLFLYLTFVIMTQLVFIATTAHMTVVSLTDSISSFMPGNSHSSLIFLLVGCGFTYNIFMDFAKDVHLEKDQLMFTLGLVEVIVIITFEVAVVVMYSSTQLCNNVYLITGYKPLSYCDFSLKFSLLICLILGIQRVIYLVTIFFPSDVNWVFGLQILVFAVLPLVISAINRVSSILHKNAENLFGPHEEWKVNPLVKEADPTIPRYQKPLACTHRCLRQYLFSQFEEARFISLRKCFAIAYAPDLFELLNN